MENSFPDNRVFVHGCAATPTVLLEAMARHGKKAQLRNVEAIHIHIEGPVTYTNPEFKGTYPIIIDHLQLHFQFK